MSENPVEPLTDDLDADTVQSPDGLSPAPVAETAERINAYQITVHSGFQTDRGLRRELNEDSFLAIDPIFAVADGMGGHEAGEVASRECIRTLSESQALASGSRRAAAADIQTALLLADARIRELTDARAGTTVTGVVLVEEGDTPYWLVFNVGDSRTYRLSKGKFEQVSVDHSEVQEMVDAGYISRSEALVHPRRHVVTRALGTGDDIEADYWLIPVEDGDRYLICSDGLTGELSDDQIFRTISTLAQPQEAADSLVQAALRSGGRDNVTVIVVDATDVLQERELLTTAPRPEVEADTLPRGFPAVQEPIDVVSEVPVAAEDEAPPEVFEPEAFEEEAWRGETIAAETFEHETFEPGPLDLIKDILDESEAAAAESDHEDGGEPDEN
ncbi:protein phosphatase [Psychromicrobium silvestre]|uniref:Protein phosphatase n=1 Tax=Psychromicrobium silvestre TaxID=1645614 RepID=A0A7Y9LW40_9MICC|nr:protein phosphatase 2C domain-containing protein [Psychromicrobium silvestre]NYE96615.1 protein phosphatase [Psychromicrobium silvestre]